MERGRHMSCRNAKPDPGKIARRRGLAAAGVAIAAAGVLAAPAAARAEAADSSEPGGLQRPHWLGQLDFGLGGEARWTSRSSMDAVTADGSRGLFTMSAGAEIVTGSSDYRVFADAWWSRGGKSGALYDDIATETSLQNYVASARVVRPLGDAAAAFARAGVGARHLSLELSRGAGSIRDSGWGALALATAGFDLTPIPPDPDLALGVRAEFGYAAERGQRIYARPAGADDGQGLQIPREDAALGRLSASGPLMRISVVAQF